MVWLELVGFVRFRSTILQPSSCHTKIFADHYININKPILTNVFKKRYNSMYLQTTTAMEMRTVEALRRRTQVHHLAIHTIRKVSSIFPNTFLPKRSMHSFA
jgi:hypothetical protein